MRRAAPSAQDMLREFAGLNARRRGDGVTPLEYQRWLDLGRRLEAAFPDSPALAKKGQVRLLVELKDEAELEACVMLNVRPVGLFVHTPFPPERGTQLELRVHVVDTGSIYSSRVSVVSNNVGPEFSTEAFGMGLKFRDADCELRAVLDELCGFPPRESEA
ncbi:MAG: PilZ domain-containing protein [Deltaproteobacteria bacterium]|nr:PilZ domain-containing protein [Deltaproteobacteria bacterium]MBW2362473.1 PilZ domain-containing protein [Deltaproteobacteria bacterium]